jgi:hypothetical protein
VQHGRTRQLDAVAVIFGRLVDATARDRVAPSLAPLTAPARSTALHATGTTSGVAALAAVPDARPAAISAAIVAVQDVIFPVSARIPGYLPHEKNAFARL